MAKIINIKGQDFIEQGFYRAYNLCGVPLVNNEGDLIESLYSINSDYIINIKVMEFEKGAVRKSNNDPVELYYHIKLNPPKKCTIIYCKESKPILTQYSIDELTKFINA
jgi:hypothetical protein